MRREPVPAPRRRAMTTTAWFHCFAGIAGDMALGALLDAGADLAEVRSLVARLPVSGWVLDVEPVLRGGIAATRAVVLAEERGVVRTYSHIAGLLEEARLPDRVRDRAQRVFRLLAEVEGRLHRRAPEQVHFHEVGSLDAIVDIVGTCAAFEVLDVDTAYASPVATGTGMIRSSHGMLPNPAPAVVELLRGAPVYGIDVTIELTTPTGAALLAGLCTGYGPLPAMRVRASGFGAGTREQPTFPNATQVVIGTAVDDERAQDAAQPLLLLEANLDDVAGEVVAHAVDILLTAGALDAWTTPITMKKGRPALTIAVLCHEHDAARLRDVLATETGTLGVRASRLQRWPLAREFDEVTVDGFPVRVKRAAHRVKVEYDDAAAVARKTGLPVREVIARAEAAARASDDGRDPQPPRIA
jgi:hypothetical protein